MLQIGLFHNDFIFCLRHFSQQVGNAFQFKCILISIIHIQSIVIDTARSHCSLFADYFDLVVMFQFFKDGTGTVNKAALITSLQIKPVFTVCSEVI